MRSISVGPPNDLAYIESEDIKSVNKIKSDNSKKPFCLNIDFHSGKSRQIYFIKEDDSDRDFRKINLEIEKVFKNNNFQKIIPEMPKAKKRKKKETE